MMKNKKTADSSEKSRSVRRTKTALRNSLIELMKTRSILHISVKEICDAADIGRSTFYAHYKDQYDLLGQIEEEIFTYFKDMLKKYFDRQIKIKAVQVFEEVLTYIANNSNNIQILLSKNGDEFFQEKLFYLFTMNKQIAKYFSANNHDDETKTCYIVFLIHGFDGLIQRWLKTNMAMPVQKLAGMMLKWIEQQVKLAM